MRHRADPTQAVVICTRDRPHELHDTLASIAEQDECASLLVVVVDASRGASLQQNVATTGAYTLGPLKHLIYPGRPSSSAQRNYGIDQLPDSVTIVHFIDDDVTVLPGYFQFLASALRDDPEVGGVGGLVIEAHSNTSAPLGATWLKQLFLLDGPVPGRILPSGRATLVQQRPCSSTIDTEWLNGCATYRRCALDTLRFDSSLAGYSLFEDRDLSYRVSCKWSLLVEPRARLLHHVSPKNRLDVEQLTSMRMVHRYWFVEKHEPHTSKSAFWWSVLGHALALVTSSHPEAPAAMRGLLRGVYTILRRDHPLLSLPSVGS